MTVIRQNQLENLDGFQVDWNQFLVPYNLGCDIVDSFSLPLQEACEADDRLTVVAIIWFMLLASELPLPERTFACRCDPLEVRPLVRSLGCEARCGAMGDLHEILIRVAQGSGIYGPHAWFRQGFSEADVVWMCFGIWPSKN